MLIAVYANQILYKVSAEPLKHVSIKAKFKCLQLVLFVTNLQKAILHLLADRGAIECKDQEGSLDVTGTVSSKSSTFLNKLTCEL